MMTRFWRGRRRESDDLSDVHALPRVALSVSGSRIAQAMANLADPVTQVDGEVIGVVNDGGPVVVTFGHEYDRHTAILRRLNGLHRVGVEVSDFAWLDPVTDPDERWLENVFALWEMGRHRDPTRMEPIDVARRRLGRLHGQIVLDRLLALVIAPGCEQRRRRTIAHAAVLTGFNTHTTEAGNALVAAGTEVDVFDGFTAMSLLDGARGIAELSRFGVATDIAEASLIPLIEHDDWHVHGAAIRSWLSWLHPDPTWWSMGWCGSLTSSRPARSRQRYAPNR